MASPPAAPVSSASQSEMIRRSERRRLAFNVMLACFGVAVAFLIGEIVVRLAGLAPANFYTYDAHLGWAMEPGAGGWQEQEGRAYLQVNRDGFRGPDYLRQKPVDTLRIAVLGDSVTEAQQVPYEDTFCVIIQRRLTAQCPLKAQIGGQTQRTFKHVEVMNFGCDGYGTWWCWRFSLVTTFATTRSHSRAISAALFLNIATGIWCWEARSRVPGRSGFIACSGSSRAIRNFSTFWGALAAS